MTKFIEQAVEEFEERFIERHSNGKTLIDRTEIWAGTVDNIKSFLTQKLEEQAKEFDLLFQSLTPQGSEFVNDPQKCIDYAKGRMKEGHEAKKNLVRQRKNLMLNFDELHQVIMNNADNESRVWFGDLTTSIMKYQEDKIKDNKNKHIGSSFDDFLREDK